MDVQQVPEQEEGGWRMWGRRTERTSDWNRMTHVEEYKMWMEIHNTLRTEIGRRDGWVTLCQVKLRGWRPGMGRKTEMIRGTSNRHPEDAMGL